MLCTLLNSVISITNKSLSRCSGPSKTELMFALAQSRRAEFIVAKTNVYCKRLFGF